MHRSRRHAPLICHCEEAAGRRGNLGKAVTILPGLSCDPAGYCEIATAPSGPRNDKLGSLMPMNLRCMICKCTRRSLSAATDAIGVYHFNGRQPVRIGSTLLGAACRSPTRRVRSAECRKTCSCPWRSLSAATVKSVSTHGRRCPCPFWQPPCRDHHVGPWPPRNDKSGSSSLYFVKTI